MQRKIDDALAIREILLNWANLSPGDISTLRSVSRTDNASLGTMVGTTHFVVWENFERLGWAERVFPALIPRSAKDRPAFFRVTPKGRERIPAFLHYYDSGPGTFYAAKLQMPDADSLNRALDTASQMCPERTNPSGLNLEARMKLKANHGNAVALALATFAHDTKRSAAEALGFHAAKDGDAAQETLTALCTRVRQKWAFVQVGLPKPERSLYDLASGLKIGLGEELAAWLEAATARAPQIAAWLAQYSRFLEEFCDHVKDRSRQSS